jgi:D-sedoheptulose 7-phosphate isomerase
MTPFPNLRAHLRATRRALDVVERDVDHVDAMGERLAGALLGGRRLLAAGNGGSAAHAQHLTSELVGRFHAERRPFDALALHAETSAVTAIVNDYGAEELFARQVLAHGRADDILLLLSTSGRSANLLRAAEVGHATGLAVWALTGPSPNPLATLADDHVAVAAPAAATVQEVHQVLVHLLCAAFDAAVERAGATALPSLAGRTAS